MNDGHADALVFFGATGDLAYKKIFPALQAMVKRGHLDVPIIGGANAGWGVAMQGDPTLFAREDYVEKAWRIVDPVLKDGTSVYEYEPGTWGPTEVDSRVSPPGGWQNPTVRLP
jgi:glucose-6-phosphate 1-dehydrogenase